MDGNNVEDMVRLLLLIIRLWIIQFLGCEEIRCRCEFIETLSYMLLDTNKVGGTQY